jgi:hypothetical protein
VAEELPDGAEVAAALEQMRRAGVRHLMRESGCGISAWRPCIRTGYGWLRAHVRTVIRDRYRFGTMPIAIAKFRRLG